MDNEVDVDSFRGAVMFDYLFSDGSVGHFKIPDCKLRKITLENGTVYYEPYDFGSDVLFQLSFNDNRDQSEI